MSAGSVSASSGAITTSAVKVSLDSVTANSPLRLQWVSVESDGSSGTVFAADRPHGAYMHDRNGATVRHYMTRLPGERFLGFGEASGAIDKAGRRLRVAATDGMGYDAQQSDPLYKHMPCFIVLTPCASAPGGVLAYGVLYDSLAQGMLDLGQEISAFRGSYRYYEAEAGDVEMYLVHGPTVLDVVERLSWLSGRNHPPPRWALGYLGSTMYYTEQEDAQTQLLKFGRLCATHGIPCSAFHLSSGYTMGDDGRRYVFSWNRGRVPDPARMFADFHSHGMKVVPNIKPWLLTSHPSYDELARAGGLLKTSDGTAPLVGRFWAGGAGTSADGSYVDFASTAGYEWWVAQVRSALVEYGADAAWNDNNEYEVDDDNAACGDAASLAPIGVVGRPLQTLLMARASRDALLAARPHERPFVVSRSGCAGTQRYAQQTWSGDNHTGWPTLKYNIPMGLSLALCGWAGNGHDVGAFAGPRPGPELFVRWVQQGVLQPRFVIHSGLSTDGKGTYTVNEPWMYPEVLSHIRAAILLRYRLVPFLHSLHLEAFLHGRPVARALACHFEPSTCGGESFLYTLGSALLAASVLEPLSNLPEGSVWQVLLPTSVRPPARDALASWCDVETGEWHAAGTRVDKRVTLGSIPLFAAAGAVFPIDLNLPATHDRALSLTAVDVPPAFGADANADAVGTGPASTHSATAVHERGLMLFVPPGFTGSLNATLYDDDGVSCAYESGGYSTLVVRVVASSDLGVSIFLDGKAPAYTHMTVVLPPGDARSVNGGNAAVLIQRREGSEGAVVAQPSAKRSRQAR